MAINRAWQIWRTALIFVFALLIGVRGSVADGYMLDRDSADGALVIRICGGIGDRFMSLDLATGELNPADGPSQDKPGGQPGDDAAGNCPFSLSVIGDVPPAPALVAVALFGPPLLSAQPVVAPLIETPFGPSLPARGPPSLS